MEIAIGPLEAILIILIFFGVRNFVKNRKEQFTGAKGVTIYYIAINIIIVLLITSLLNEINDPFKFNSTEEAAFVWIFFGFGIIGGWILLMIVFTILEFAILTPFVLICNFIFYKLYLNNISLIKEKSISNLELSWKITTPLAILLIAFLYAKNMGILLIFTIQYLFFSLITKKVLKIKIAKMRDLDTLGDSKN